MAGLALLPGLPALAARAGAPVPDIARRERPRLRFEDILSGRNAVPERIRALTDGGIAFEYPDQHIVLETSSTREAVVPRTRTGQFLSVSPCGRHCCFLREQVWWIVSDQGPERQLRPVPEPAGNDRFEPFAPASWSPDSSRLVIAYRVAPAVPTEAAQPEIVDGVPIIEVGRRPPDVEHSRSRIDLVALQGNLLATKIIPGLLSGVDVAADHQVYVVTSHQDFNSAEVISTATIVTALSSNLARTTQIFSFPGLMPQAKPAVSPDGRKIALAIDVDNQRWNDFCSVVVVDVMHRTMRRLTDSVYVNASLAWTADSSRIVFTSREGAFDQIYMVTLAGALSRLTNDARRFYDMSELGGQLHFQTLDLYGRRDFIAINRETGGPPALLRTLDDPNADYSLGAAEQVTWRNELGLDIFGLLFHPPGPATSGRPLVVDIHGGGTGSRLYLEGPFSMGVAPGPLEWHAWAAKGYLVFVPDYRSSGQYGPEVARRRYAGIDDELQGDVRDIEAGIDAIVARNSVDRSKIVGIGHSAGGPRLSILITNSDRMRAAVLNDPIPAGRLEILLSYWTTGKYTGRKFEQVFRPSLGARLSERPDLYTSTYLLSNYRCVTPTLIMVGQQSEVPPLAAETFYTVLRQYDVDARLIRFVDQGHVYTSKPAARLAFNEAAQWFDHHLSGPRTEHRT